MEGSSKELPCPLCLQRFTFSQIQDAFTVCYNKRSSLNVYKPNSLFGKVYTHLTGFKQSTLTTRMYLNHMWTTKVKDIVVQQYQTHSTEIKRRKTERRNKGEKTTKRPTLQLPAKRPNATNPYLDSSQKRFATSDNAPIINKTNDPITISPIPLPNPVPKNTPIDGTMLHVNLQPTVNSLITKVNQLFLVNQQSNCSENSSDAPTFAQQQIPNNIITNSISQAISKRLQSSILNSPTRVDLKAPHNTPIRGPGRKTSFKKRMEDLALKVKQKLTIHQQNNPTSQPPSFQPSAPPMSPTNTNTRLSIPPIQPSQSFIQIEASTRDDDAEERELQKIMDEINKELRCYATFPCTICRKKIQPTHKRRSPFKINNAIITLMNEFNCQDFELDQIIYVCLRCKRYLEKKKIPSQAYFNNMEAPPTPHVIEQLNEVEARLISQVKPFLKIFQLQNGRGQQALRGSCIHFPQDITEVVQQLPLNISNSDIIIVKETAEQTSKDFEIRPQVVNDALLWLKENNPLYANIETNDTFDGNVEFRELHIGAPNAANVEEIVLEAQRGSPQFAGFQYISAHKSILLASVNQSSVSFSVESRGNQCTAIAAAAIAYATYQDPSTWTQSIMNSVLIRGDTFYKNIMATFTSDHSKYLTADEVKGIVSVFDENNQFEIIPSLETISGVVNQFPDNKLYLLGDHYPHQKTEAGIQQFMQSANNYAIFTTGLYSVALIKTAESAYYFDSHSRGDRGWITKDNNGFACMVKFDLEHATSEITKLISRNLQTKTAYQDGQIHRFLYTITPVLAVDIPIDLGDDFNNDDENYELQQPAVHQEPVLHQEPFVQQETFVCQEPGLSTHSNSNVPSTGQHSPAELTTKFGYTPDPNIDYNQPSLCSLIPLPNLVQCSAPSRMIPDIRPPLQVEDNVSSIDKDTTVFPVPQNSNPQQANIDHQHINNIQLDCMIAADNFVEPQLENVVHAFRQNKEYELQRERLPPVYPEKQKRLEELSFIKMFPYGTHGLSQQRKLKISPLEYFQQKIMSTDKRFHTNEYLFYAVAEVERYTAQKKISICGNMRTEGDRDNDGENVNLPGFKNIHLYMSALRGSASYWKKYKGDLCAMIEQLGCPTFFITFSYDDLNSSDAVTAIWKEMEGLDAEISDPSDIPYETRKKALNDHPTAAARHFNHRMNVFLRKIQQHAEFLFGTTVLDWTFRVEFQQRGSPHIHSLFWLKNVPSWSTDAGIAFIDKNVSCSLNVKYKDLVIRHQNHHHTKTCYRVPKVCRFAYPRPETSVTRILDDAEIEKNSGRFVDIKRTKAEQFINNYHPKLLRLLKSNMDIQPVTNSKSIAYYIGKYMSKGEPEVIRAEIQKILNEIKGDSHSANKNKALKVCSTLMSKREICAQEAVYKLCHLPMRKSSRATVFMPAFPKRERVRMILKDSITNENIQHGKNGIDRYLLRPPDIQHLCLLEFMAHYEPKQSEAQENIDQDLIEEEDEEVRPLRAPEITLTDNKTKMKRRKNPAIVKRPFFNPSDDSERYFYSLLLSYCPFDSEDLFEGFDSYRAAFIHFRPTFRSHEDDPILRIDLAELINNAFAQALIQNEREARLGANDIIHDDEINIFEDPNDILTPREVFQNAPDFNPDDLNFDSINARVANLTHEQRHVYDMVYDKVMNPNSPPVRLFVSGEGGTGKSYLLQTCKMLINLMARNTETVLVGAVTGVAALGIGGSTIHKLFSLGIERGGIGRYMELGGRKLEERRRIFRHVSWLFIDEISLMNYQLFRSVHLRAVQICNSDELFANWNIIVWGDLLQLEPINGCPIFVQPRVYSAEPHLWREFKCIQLRIVKRQADGDPLREILAALRLGNLRQTHFDILQTRLLHESNPSFQRLLCESLDVLHVFPTLREVASYNSLKTSQLSATTNIYKIRCIDTFADGPNVGQPAPDNYVPTDDRKCAGIPRELEIGVGSRVMLRRNLNVEYGLANGCMGVVEHITWPINPHRQVTEGELPRNILVRFDNRIHESLLHNGLVTLTPKTFEYTGNRLKNLSRYQLPVIVSFATSCHKIQVLP